MEKLWIEVQKGTQESPCSRKWPYRRHIGGGASIQPSVLWQILYTTRVFWLSVLGLGMILFQGIRIEHYSILLALAPANDALDLITLINKMNE